MMKFLKSWFLLVAMLFLSGPAFGQFSISNVTPADASTVIRMDSINQVSDISNPYFSPARAGAERLRVRKERNTFTLRTSMELNQTGYDNWAAGGDNTFSARADFYLRHIYRLDKFTVDYSLDMRYGMNYIESIMFKNQDLFLFNGSTEWKVAKNWSFAASINFKTQFAKGFKSRTDKTLISDFMSPGTLDLAIGFTYQKPNHPLKINISPLTGSMTFVLSDTLSKAGKFGVDKGRHQKSQLGSSVRVTYEKEFAKKRLFYQTTMYSFTNYTSDTRVRWDNLLEIRATKFLSATLNAALLYDKYAETPRKKAIQTYYSLGIRLRYEYKNK